MPVEVGRKILRMPEAERKVVLLRVPEKLYEKLNAAAASELTSVNWACVKLLNDALESRRQSNEQI